MFFFANGLKPKAQYGEKYRSTIQSISQDINVQEFKFKVV